MLQEQYKIDLLNSRLLRMLEWRLRFNSAAVKILRVIVYVLATGCLGIVSLTLFSPFSLSENLIALICFYLGLTLIFLMIDLYVNFSDSHPKIDLKHALQPSSGVNIIEYLDSQAALVLARANQIKQKNGLGQIDALLMFLALAKTNVGNILLLRCEIYADQSLEEEVIKICREKPDNPSGGLISLSSREILIKALYQAAKEGRPRADLQDLFVSLFEKNAVIQKVFANRQIKLEDVLSLASWHRRYLNYTKKQYYWQKEYFGRGIGQDWASGYTPVLNYFARDISEYLADIKLQALAEGRSAIISNIEDVLMKSGRNNIMLIGEAGVGKRTTVNAFAQKVVRGQTIPALRYKHILELNVNQILAGASERELQVRLNNILDEAIRAGNIILFINNFDKLVNPEFEQLGTIDASQFLIPYLESSQLQILAACDYNAWHKKVEANPTLANLFSKIEIQEPKIEEMTIVLQDAVLALEARNKVIFTYNALKSIINLTDRYVHDEVFPQKAIDLAQSTAVTHGGTRVFKLVTQAEIEQFASARFKVPVAEATKEEKDKLLNLEGELHKRLIDQEQAVKLVADALRRARAGLAQKNKPVGSFLFIGPTGVGKTETAKALADIYFGSEKNIIRFDMSEYQMVESIQRLLGSDKVTGGAEQGRLSVAIRNNPYTIVLFDEVEKAHPNILNLFLQMLDEGYITDATNRKLDFTNSIIIATSNAGAEQIRQYLKSGQPIEQLSGYILDYLQKGGIFRPEFLNRFDAIVCYQPLAPEHILQVARLMVGKLKETIRAKDVELEITDAAMQKLAQLGYDPLLGARPMRRTIQDKVENMLAKRLLSGEIQRGQKVIVDEGDII